MNILYAIRHKGKIVLLLFALGSLIIANCHAYNQNIAEMGNSVSEVYADRLMAQDYIYKLAGKIHERKWSLSEDVNASALPGTHGLSILSLLRDYEKTKFTAAEKIVYEEFRINIFKMIALQQRYGSTENSLTKQAVLQSYKTTLDASLQQLEKLSEIQMQRGKNINANSQKIVSFSSLLKQLDWALIFIIMIIIMAIVFATKSTFSRQFQNHLLN